MIIKPPVTRILGVIAICSTALLVCGAFGPAIVPEVRTRRLTLVDEYGRDVGFIAGANGQARLELHNLANRTSAVVAAEDEASVQLGTVNKDRVRLFNKGELSALEVRGAQGKLRILMGISDTGKPKVVLCAANGDIIWQAPPDEKKSDAPKSDDPKAGEL